MRGKPTNKSDAPDDEVRAMVTALGGQAATALKLGVSRQSVCYWFNGHPRAPQVAVDAMRRLVTDRTAVPENVRWLPKHEPGANYCPTCGSHLAPPPSRPVSARCAGRPELIAMCTAVGGQPTMARLTGLALRVVERWCSHLKARPKPEIVALMSKLAALAQSGAHLTPCYRCYCLGPENVAEDRKDMPPCERCRP